MSATLHTTLGDIKVELLCAEVPRVCENWLGLAAAGRYDDSELHRNIPGFMIQGGAPKGAIKGGDCIWGGRFEDQFHPKARHDRRGVLSMANKGPNTNGAQFFILYAPQPHLDDVHCVFGHVLEGLDVLDKMEQAPLGAKDRPVTPILINSITIHANPLAA